MNVFCWIGLHAWHRIWATAHWYVECRRCGRREVWLNKSWWDYGSSPIDHTWSDHLKGRYRNFSHEHIANALREKEFRESGNQTTGAPLAEGTDKPL